MTHHKVLWFVTILNTVVGAMVAYWLAMWIMAPDLEAGPVSSIVFFQ
jgi:hypothetical protein